MMKKVGIIGVGYVGGVSAACFAEKGHQVLCVDSNEEKIKQWNSNQLPIYEPGLEELVFRNRGKNLFFTSDIKKVIADSEIIFECVNTPTKKRGVGKGDFDRQYIDQVAREIAYYANRDRLIVEKSTVPFRTAARLEEVLNSNKKKDIRFRIVSNPEFLAEGTAVKDFFEDRVLIGTKEGDELSKKEMKELYYFIPEEKIIFTNIWSSELTKLMNNAMLSMRISYINSIAPLCEQTGADATEVANAVGMDYRIGERFLKAGVGWGGSCFGKDLGALIYLLRQQGFNEQAKLFEQVVKINYKQRTHFVEVMHHQLFSLNNKEVAIYGFSFKPNTDDIRDAPAISISKKLIEEGAKIRICDPSSSLRKAEGIFGRKAAYFSEPYEAVQGAEVIALITEWELFKGLDFKKVFNLMKKPAWLFDGRNLYDPKEMFERGFNYYGVGRMVLRHS